MRLNIPKSLLFFGLFSVFLLSLFILNPLSLTLYPAVSAAETIEEQEDRLRKELEQYEKELQTLNVQLGELNKQSASYQRDVNLLTAQIKQAQTNIKAKNLSIKNLTKEINNKTETIKVLDTRIEKGKESMAQLLRKTNELDSYNAVEVFLADKNLTGFFQDIQTFASIQNSLEELFHEIRGTKTKTIAEKEDLRQKQNKELDAKAAIEASERQIALKEAEQRKLLNETKNQEQGYKNVIAEKQKKAAAIRAALFRLRDSDGIPFGTAYEYALEAEKQTGIRPAFLLAILTQETNLGKNVGTCNRPGDPPEKQWMAIMKPERDQAPYLEIIKSLGLEPESKPLSCPWGTGWGGAMGPAQFIPSTWMLFKDRIANAAGVAVANPWDPQHAFMASSIYLTDLGAAAQTYSAERDAACRYYSGRRCDAAAPANSFYGDQVMAKAITIQETMIDPIK